MEEAQASQQEELDDISFLEDLKDIEELQDCLIDFEAGKIGDLADKIEALTEEGKTFKDLFNVSDEIMKLYYSCAYDLLQKDSYEKSAHAFLFLTMLDPYVYDYWMGLGFSQSKRDEFDKALKAYGMATLINIDHPAPYLFSAQCYQQIHDKENAMKSVEWAITTSEGKEEFQDFHDEATRIKNIIS
jgi:type III secretion system low calcium response chaperone LcrH/SycD